jgi:hypothetical protein
LIKHDEHRKEVAKAMASLGDNFTLLDTAPKEPSEEPPKKANPSQGKIRRAPTGLIRQKVLSTVLPPSNLKRGKNLRKQKCIAIPDLEDNYRGK